MALLDEVRTWLRVSADVYDAEIATLIESALTDMRRVGVREELLDPDSLYPLAKKAVMVYAKAQFGFDNKEADRFMLSYQQTVADLLNSSANEMDEESETYSRVASYADGLLDAILPPKEG